MKNNNNEIRKNERKVISSMTFCCCSLHIMTFYTKEMMLRHAKIMGNHEMPPHYTPKSENSGILRGFTLFTSKVNTNIFMRSLRQRPLETQGENEKI